MMKKIEKIRKELRNYYYIENTFNNNEKGYLYDVCCDLSIIVPFLNAEPYIAECIESLCNQNTSFSYEIIFVNDGSTDSSSKTVRKYLDSSSNMILLEQSNKGLSSARNYGLRYARGKYVTFVDADDYISLDFIEKMIGLAYKNDADMVKCGYNEFNNQTGEIIKKYQYRERIVNYSSPDYANIKGHACMCIINRNILKNIRFPLGYLFEDLIMLFLVMPTCNKIYVSNDCLYYYRINLDSISRNKNDKKSYKCLSHILLLEDILCEMNNYDIPKNDNYQKVLIHTFGTMAWLRSKKLAFSLRYKVFLVACDDYKKNSIKCKNIELFEKLMNYSLNHKIFTLWSLLSIAKMMTIKYGKDIM